MSDHVPTKPETDEPEIRPELSTVVADLNRVADAQQAEVFEDLIEQVEPSELGLLLESLPVHERIARWQQVPDDERIAALVGMRGESRETILSSLDEQEITSLLSGMDAEDLIELFENLPDQLVDFAVTQMDQQHRIWFEQSSQFELGQIGRYVDHQVVMLPPNTRVGEALRVLRRTAYPFSDRIYVVHKGGHWCGEVSVQALLSVDRTHRLDQMLEQESQLLSPDMGLTDAAERLEHSNQSAMPVVNQQGQFIGRVTLRDALEILREHYESQLMARAGLSEDADLFLPIWQSSKRRAIWLGLNLLTALLASWTIGLFEDTLSTVVALAVLMPIVASMGGIAGSQTLTLIIRGLAMGQISLGNALALCRKEIGVALINGVLWAAVIGLIAFIWFDSIDLGLVIAIAIIVNITTAALAGVLIPVVLDRLKIDPALSGSVILTTVTDIVGFFTFLGLGSLFLIH